MIINEVQDIAVHFGPERGTEWHRVQKALFKGTECGAWIEAMHGQIKVGSIVEGADVNCTPHVLSFPFHSSELEHALDMIEDEAEAIWQEWNNPNGEEDWDMIAGDRR